MEELLTVRDPIEPVSVLLSAAAGKSRERPAGMSRRCSDGPDGKAGRT